MSSDDDQASKDSDQAFKDHARVLQSIRTKYPNVVLVLDDEETVVHFLFDLHPSDCDAVLHDIQEIYAANENQFVAERSIEGYDNSGEDEDDPDNESPTNSDVDDLIDEALGSENEEKVMAELQAKYPELNIEREDRSEVIYTLPQGHN